MIPAEIAILINEKISNMRVYLQDIVPAHMKEEISTTTIDIDGLHRNFALFLLTGANADHIYRIVKKRFNIVEDNARLLEYCECIFSLLASASH